MKIVSKSQKETQDIAMDLGKKIKRGTVLAFYGDLGSGKTTFVQAIAKELGIKRRMISPTFVIMRNYKNSKFNFYHIDLYRLNSEKEIEDLGILDLLNNPKNILAIEWAEKMEKLLPKNAIKIHLKYLGDEEREIEIK